MPDAPILSVSEACVRFGGVDALVEVDFTIETGTVTALIGPNGAGKTTLLGAVTGMVPMHRGRVVLAGRDVTAMAPHARALAGVVRTFQNLEVFANMTVLENVMTGRHALVRYGIFDGILRTPRFRAGERACREAALDRLDFVGLADKKDLLAGELPYGSQRLLEMARAVAAEPKLLLLDEPAAGLNTRETQALAALIARVRDELGITVGLVEHDMDLVMGISDAVTVLSFGAVLASGTPRRIQENPDVVAAYLGD
ncbi:ABC transporter ATP-binding protein [Desulfolutivibrio sulfoxidireducens]|uniref:ABC transporter ATP-binding protein n=1 Tax=Desulfolutivibrio sulfoxidireducens TaxID=2773299 RepID=UPI00159E4C52|nr:ABC transporter ATP-binding protein [Desulfolutivibrio sulfoxidireducens]QLA15048.1 ATP-binding cassette domain-containing protein [Desulfolutivibrio sulfoxidireducens]QLA18617.1 ATP-binding cassette domain-containing protein [Desulfolutivibrio sulfoxidireducens]